MDHHVVITSLKIIKRQTALTGTLRLFYLSNFKVSFLFFYSTWSFENHEKHFDHVPVAPILFINNDARFRKISRSIQPASVTGLSNPMGRYQPHDLTPDVTWSLFYYTLYHSAVSIININIQTQFIMVKMWGFYPLNLFIFIWLVRLHFHVYILGF